MNSGPATNFDFRASGAARDIPTPLHAGASVSAGGPSTKKTLAAERDDARLRQIDERLDLSERLLHQAQEPAAERRVSAEARVSIVLPVYNRAAVIERVVERIMAVPMLTELIVIDDGSTDGTGNVLYALAERLPIRVFRNARTQGYGSALQRGFAAASGDVIVIGQADLGFDPAELPALVKPIALGCCDVIYGTCSSTSSTAIVEHGSPLPPARRRLPTRVSNLITGQNLSDLETPYKVFRRDLLRNFVLRQNCFGCELELTTKLARHGRRIYELPVRGAAGDRGSRRIRLGQMFRTLWCLARYALAD